jgi:hypothetical protein
MWTYRPIDKKTILRREGVRNDKIIDMVLKAIRKLTKRYDVNTFRLAFIAERWEQDHAAGLHRAIKAKQLPVVKQLMATGDAHYSLSLPDGILPVHRAAMCGSLEILKFLLDQINNPDILRKTMDMQSLLGYSTLHWAARYGHHDIVEYLIDKGCDTGLTNSRGRTAWGEITSTPSLKKGTRTGA